MNKKIIGLLSLVLVMALFLAPVVLAVDVQIETDSNTDTSNTDTSNTDTSNTDTSNTETSNTETSNTETSNTDTSNTDTTGAGELLEVEPQAPPVYDVEDAMKILPTIINYVFGFLLMIVVLMILVAGYMFVTGGGSPEKITQARTLLMWALVGLAIAVVARGLIAIVGKLLGSDIDI